MKKRTIAAILAGGVISALAVEIYRESPNVRMRNVRKWLGQIPDIEVNYVSDLNKQASEAITAWVKVNGKGTMAFTGMEQCVFDGSRHIYITEIAGLSFRTHCIDEHGRECCGWAIDIGSDSDITEMARLNITTIQEAILHYDDVLACVSQWPSATNELPEPSPAIRIKDRNGHECQYSAQRSQPAAGALRHRNGEAQR